MIEQVIVNPNALSGDIYNNIYSVEEVNKCVMNGMSFREAYQQVAKNISEENYLPDKTVVHTHEGSISNLCMDQIKEKFDKQFNS